MAWECLWVQGASGNKGKSKRVAKGLREQSRRGENGKRKTDQGGCKIWNKRRSIEESGLPSGNNELLSQADSNAIV